MTTPAEGYVVYIDDYPTANHFHPVRYAFVNSTTGSINVVDADSPPENYTEYTAIETEIWSALMAVENRRAPKPANPAAPTDNERWAVLMNGGISSWSNHVRYWNDLSNIYIALNSTYGFADDHIIVLCSDGLDPAPDQSNGQNSDPDLDGDGDDDIMFPCILNLVDAVFDSLAGILTEEDFLFVFATDHGSSNGGWNTSFNLWNNQAMTDAHFASLLGALPQCTIVGTFEPCYSGGFLDNMIVPPGPRVGSSACRYDQLSWAMPPTYEYDTYVFHWTAAVKGEDAYGVVVNADYNNDGIVTMDEAYVYAETHDQSNEDPQYDDYPVDIGMGISLWPTGPGPNVSITLTPVSPPIIIPASGGTFSYSVEIINNEPDPVAFNAWIDVTLPTGSTTEPLLGPINLNLDGGESINRERTQSVPDYAPSGQYSYNAYVGINSSLIWAEDNFNFEKLASGDGLSHTGWENWGEPFDESESMTKPVSRLSCAATVSPNPFNPSTVISYQLSTVSHVNLSVYDIAGRKVAELIDGWRDAGIHEVTFAASELASGVYIYQINTGGFTASGKMLLVK
jgi:hypothetical protein